jgi:hypothetical protein
MNCKLLSTEIGEKAGVPATARTLTWCHAATEAAAADRMAEAAVAAGACQALPSTRLRSVLSPRTCRTCRRSVSSRVRQPSTETDTTTDQVAQRFFLFIYFFFIFFFLIQVPLDNVLTAKTGELMGLNRLMNSLKRK